MDDETGSSQIRRFRLKYLFRVALVFCAYFVTATLGLKMDAVSGFATLVWPPTGIALAVLLLFGRRLWPGIFLGAFLVNFMTGASVLPACGIALGNTLEAVVATTLLQRLNFHNSLDRLRDVILLIIIAVLGCTTISATMGVMSLWFAQAKSLEGLRVTWQAWWIGDALGNLIVAPLLLSWVTQPWKKLKPGATVQAIGGGASLVALGLFIFSDMSLHLGIPNPSLPYVFFPFLVWSSLRFGQFGNTATSFVMATIAIWHTAQGRGPFAHDSLRDNLFLLDSYLSVIATTGLILAASIMERKQATEAAKQGNEALQKIEAELKEAIKSRDEFLSIASHELKTPITSLSLQIQMAKMGVKPEEKLAPPPERLAKIFDVSGKQVDRLTRLVEDLLDVSRIQTRRLIFNFEKINLSEIVIDMADRYVDQLAKTSCSLECDIQKDISGYFDHSRIEQVLDNLLTNVIKYAPGKPVKISLQLTGETVTLAVKDQGPGIPEEKQSKIFKRFERATSSRSITGLGLGLFIVEEIVKDHGGTVTIESKVGAGAQFIVKMPIGIKEMKMGTPP